MFVVTLKPPKDPIQASALLVLESVMTILLPDIAVWMDGSGWHGSGSIPPIRTDIRSDGCGRAGITVMFWMDCAQAAEVAISKQAAKGATNLYSTGLSIPGSQG
jgi:hypothetical protein